MDLSYILLSVLASIPTMFAIGATQAPRDSPKVATGHFLFGTVIFAVICVTYWHSDEFVSFEYVELEKFWAFRAFTFGVFFGATASVASSICESAFAALVSNKSVAKK